MSADVLTPSEADAIADLLTWGAYGRAVARAMLIDPDEAIVDAFMRRTS